MATGDSSTQDGHEHVWKLRRIHLSVRRGAEVEEECVDCPGGPGRRYVPDWAMRKPRPKLPPTRRLRGE